MTERAWFVVLVVGVVLTALSVLGVSVVALTQGLVAWPQLDVEIGSTGFTRVCLLIGAVLIGTGSGVIVAMFARPRKPRAAANPTRRPVRRPARANPGCPNPVDAGRVHLFPPDATAALPGGRIVDRAAASTPGPRPVDTTMEFRPRGSGVTRGRIAASRAEGSRLAAPSRRSLSPAPRDQRPALPPGGGQVWTTAGPQLWPQVEGPQRVRATGLDETRHT